MGKRFLLDVAPTGVQHSVEIDNDGGGFTAIEHTPTRIESAILDDCSRLRSLHQRKSNFQHAAKIPINTYYQWKREWREHIRAGGSLSWSQFEVIKLNNRDNCNLRTGNGRSAFGKKL